MAGWLDRLLGKHTASSRGGPAALLGGYPPYTAPHAGPPRQWSLAQARENLEYLLAQRERRLTVLRGLLAREGIDIDEALQGGQTAALLASLHRWVNDKWPALHDPRIATVDAWLRSDRQGREIAYSLVMDVAILLGELIARRHAGYRWALDLDEENGRDDMPSYKRPVLLLPAFGGMPKDIVLDVEDVVASRYRRPHDAAARALDEWAELVHTAVSGGYEAFWVNGDATVRPGT